MHHLKKVTNFCLNIRYADHKKTLDKYGGSKETISIWAPSHTPHIPKIAKNWNSLLPETTLSIHLHWAMRHWQCSYKFHAYVNWANVTSNGAFDLGNVIFNCPETKPRSDSIGLSSGLSHLRQAYDQANDRFNWREFRPVAPQTRPLTRPISDSIGLRPGQCQIQLVWVLACHTSNEACDHAKVRFIWPEFRTVAS